MAEYCLAKAEVEGSSPFSRFLRDHVLHVKVRLLVLGTSIFQIKQFTDYYTDIP